MSNLCSKRENHYAVEWPKFVLITDGMLFQSGGSNFRSHVLENGNAVWVLLFWLIQGSAGRLGDRFDTG
jgi:hypothetical protein